MIAGDWPLIHMENLRSRRAENLQK